MESVTVFVRLCVIIGFFLNEFKNIQVATKNVWFVMVMGDYVSLCYDMIDG